MDRFRHHRGALLVALAITLGAAATLVGVVRARDGVDVRFVALGLFAAVFAGALLLLRHRRYVDQG